MGVDKNSRENVIFYPSPGMSYLRPMVEFARVLISRNQTLDVTILLLKPSLTTGSIDSFVSSVTATNPFISFHFLPLVHVSDLGSKVRFDDTLFGLIRRSKPNVENYISSRLHRRPLAFVVDDFCAGSTEMAIIFSIPTYIFFTGSAAGLGVFLHLPTAQSLITQSFKDMGTSPVVFPGIPPIPADHMPLALHDREDESYKSFLQLSKYTAEATGIIINTFDALEGNIIRSLQTTEASTHPIYSVGPLIFSDGGCGGGEKSEICCYFKWLDMQPKGSVVFLCFGSMETFSHHQLEEIATGLERTQRSFLWVVKKPQLSDSDNNCTLDSVLPKGFLDRTKDRGLVVEELWAPQVAVLQHEAIGCFVTHLGWNSVLEAISTGVGMIGWPLYAEQKMNKVFVVDDMKLAIPMEGYDKELVTAAEVERSVKKMMEEGSEIGASVKERCSAMKYVAAETVGDGGTSTLALDQLVKDWRIGRKSSELLVDIVDYQFKF
ncbi:Flavonoid glucosyltransferase, family GT1 [Zostera marina]|uniref:Flavonoid glucosyltransferase, family GT1 n=1 Tax=Zostera marina TaxID=29655 RepID=A0A0K9Q449_ZOSMR|nr:Flavonoid glucosyltransferase, family GT1 [Zostera marina]